MTQVCEALSRVMPDGSLVPALAESWEMSPDGKTYVYKIRKGVKFHDGTELTAEDVAYSMNRNLDPEVGSYLAGLYSRVDKIEATGDYELTVTMKMPEAVWKYTAAATATFVSSKAWIEKNGKDVGTEKVGIIGTGPYKFVSWQRGQEHRPRAIRRLLEQGPSAEGQEGRLQADRRRADHRPGPRQRRDRLHLQPVRQELRPALGLRQCRARHGPVVQRRLPRDQHEEGALERQARAAGDRLLAGPPGHPGGLLREPGQGLGAADHRRAMVHRAGRLQEGVRRPADVREECEKAKQLIKEAGAEGAKGEVLVGNDYDVPAALAIQDAAKQLGMTIDVKRLPQQEKFALEFSGEPRTFDMTITIWGSDWPDPAATSRSRSTHRTSSRTSPSTTTPTVMQLIDAQGEELDPKKRAELITEAQAIIVDELPVGRPLPDVDAGRAEQADRRLRAAADLLQRLVAGGPLGPLTGRVACVPGRARWTCGRPDMAGVIARRLIGSALLIVASSFIVFSLIYIAPGDPVDILLGGRPADAATRAAIRAAYNLDQPFVGPVRHLAHERPSGRPGRSVALRGTPVSDLISDRVVPTFQLALYASLLVTIVGLTLGLVTGVQAGDPHRRGREPGDAHCRCPCRRTSPGSC